MNIELYCTFHPSTRLVDAGRLAKRLGRRLVATTKDGKTVVGLAAPDKERPHV